MESLLGIAGRETAESDERNLKSKMAMRLKLEFLLLRLSLACSICLRGDSGIDCVTTYETVWDVGQACMDT